ncbi:MAG: hypothetical protein ACI865_003243, partial [Flavobacteriaceae bacterium]
FCLTTHSRYLYSVYVAFFNPRTIIVEYVDAMHSA